MFPLAFLLSLSLVTGPCYVTADVIDTRESQCACEKMVEDIKLQMREQSALLSHLQARLAAQEKSNVDQEAQLLLMENSVRPQGVAMTQKKKVISLQGAALEQGRTQSGNRQDVHDTKITLQLQRDPDVKARADDFGTLEAVTLQMSQQLSALNAELQALKSNYMLHNASLYAGYYGASTYVRWGSSTCGGGSQLLYAGVMGGEHDSHPGSAANYLCLTMSPVPSDQTHPQTVAHLYGTEYETGGLHQNKDAVCAVCRSGLATTLMIPGTNVCSPGWTTQYSGFLMAGYSAHPAGSEYICVDASMESRVGGDANNDGKLLYFTVAQCGSLPCQPYVNGKVVTCVVCSL